MKPLKVSEVARLAKVTVRTLHHYDALGLVCPSERSASGYRLYTQADLERLQAVRFWRALGFPLEAIPRLLAEDGPDRTAALERQRAHLASERTRLTRLLSTIDAALAARKKGKPMQPKQLFEGFEENPYEAEAQQRWGDTAAWKESKRRTQKYSKADWDRFRAEQQAQLEAMAAAVRRGVAPSAPEARELAERHRLAIDRWFYPCPHALHRQLGAMYVADERFTATYERVAPGLAAWLSAAIAANADAAEAGSATPSRR